MRLNFVLNLKLPLCRWRFEYFLSYNFTSQSQADLSFWPLNVTETTIRRLTTPAHMAQSGLLSESTSIEYVPRLSPPTPRNPSYASTLSIDSVTNYSPQGEATESATPPSTLPTFYPSGSRDVTPSSDPDKSPRNWLDTLFHGWRVVIFSCMFVSGFFLSSSD